MNKQANISQVGIITGQKQWFIQLFQAACMAAPWSIYLLVYWPGISMSDSVATWNDFYLNRISDSLSVLYSLIMKLMASFWFRPVPYVILQILCMSLVVAWGLRVMRSHGVSLIVTWIVTALFAIFPINGAMVNFIVKDVPYSITFLAFSILVIEIVWSNGEWIKKPAHWVILGLVGVALALFRLNGLPVVLGTVLVLLLLFPYRKQFIFSILLFSLLHSVVVGPVYDLLHVNRASVAIGNTIFLFHIAAHVNNKTALDASDQDLLDSLLPIDRWSSYYGCKVDSIYWQGDFNRGLFAEHSTEIRAIFLKTLLKNPLINLQHMLGAFDYLFNPFTTRCHPQSTSLIFIYNGQVNWSYHLNWDWVDPAVQAALRPNSKIPSLVEPLYVYIMGSKENPVLYFLFWKNSFHLFAAIVITVLLAFKRKNWKFLLISIPIVIQTLVLAVGYVSHEFRYQYPVTIFFLFSLCFLELLISPNAKRVEPA